MTLVRWVLSSLPGSVIVERWVWLALSHFLSFYIVGPVSLFSFFRNSFCFYSIGSTLHGSSI